MRRMKPEPGFPGSGFGFDQSPRASRPLVKETQALGTRLEIGQIDWERSLLRRCRRNRHVTSPKTSAKEATGSDERQLQLHAVVGSSKLWNDLPFFIRNI